MCTAMVTQTPQGDVYFGRTMDFSYPLESELYVVPKGFQWNNIMSTHQVRNHYCFMGIGQDMSPAVSADGVNEMEFGAAVLYFPGYARYGSPDPEDPSRPAVTALELTRFLLDLNASVEGTAFILHTIRIAGVQDSITGTIAPLHWLVAGRTGRSIAIEKTTDGLHLMDNPIGVLSSGPNFQQHSTDLHNYVNLSASRDQSQAWGSLELTSLGQGVDSFRLPGDYTPPSRFIKATFLKTRTPTPAGGEGAALTCFHIMESVSIPKSPVTTGRNTPDYT